MPGGNQISFDPKDQSIFEDQTSPIDRLCGIQIPNIGTMCAAIVRIPPKIAQKSFPSVSIVVW